MAENNVIGIDQTYAANSAALNQSIYGTVAPTPNSLNIASITPTATVSYQPTLNNVTVTSPIGNGILGNPTIGTPPAPPVNQTDQKGANASKDHAANITKAANNVTPDSLIDLERKSGLDTDDLVTLKGKFSRINDNYWYLLLCFLVYGFDYHVMTANQNPDHVGAAVDENFIRDFKSIANTNNPTLQNIVKKTPAYKKGCFDNVGYFGVTHGVNANLQQANPMSGPAKQAGTSLVEKLLNTINTKINSTIEHNCASARTKAYLALPATAYASFQKAVAAINGIIAGYEQLLNAIYQGVIQLVQQIYAVINGIIAAIQFYILSLINKYIIPIDLLCLILELLGTFFDDSKFYSSLFNQSAFLNKYLNQFQSEISKELSLAGSILSSAQPNFSPEVNQIIRIVNSLAMTPSLGTGLQNYGYSQSLLGLQAQIVGQIVSKYGPNFAALTPVGSQQAGNVSPFPPTQTTFGYNSYQSYGGNSTYINTVPITPQLLGQNVLSNVSQPFNAIGGNFANNIGNAFSTIGTSVGNLGAAAKDLGTAVNNAAQAQ